MSSNTRCGVECIHNIDANRLLFYLNNNLTVSLQIDFVFRIMVIFSLFSAVLRKCAAKHHSDNKNRLQANIVKVTIFCICFISFCFPRNMIVWIRKSLNAFLNKIACVDDDERSRSGEHRAKFGTVWYLLARYT